MKPQPIITFNTSDSNPAGLIHNLASKKKKLSKASQNLLHRRGSQLDTDEGPCPPTATPLEAGATEKKE